MEIERILLFLKNSGLQNLKVDDSFIYFDDPSCIYTAFDTILNYAWFVIVILTALMILGWGLLYIKNGVKINDLFNNAKIIILIFAILSAVKPIVNVIYGEKLFGRNCEVKHVSLSEVHKLIELRNKTLSNTNEEELYEVFEIIVSGPNGDAVSITDEADEDIESFESYDPETSQALINQLLTNADNNFTPTAQHSGGGRVIYGDNYVIIINPNGEKTKHTGGSRSWRNNNPGNIINSQFTREHGAIGDTGKFAVFPDEQTGLRAVATLLRTKNYINLPIKEATKRYAPAADNNDPVRYAQKITRLTGISSDRTIKSLNDQELQKIVRAIQIIEGWKPGTETKIEG